MLTPRMNAGLPEVSATEVYKVLGKIRIIDVRSPEEFSAGHISGAENIPLGPQVFQWIGSADRQQDIVFVCHSGSRSGHATQLALDWGFRKVYNLEGGMMDWIHQGLPITPSPNL